MKTWGITNEPDCFSWRTPVRTDDFAQKIITQHALIARVITQATSIESIINAYIAEYYTHHPNSDYQNSYLSLIFDILNNRSVSLNTKIEILFKVFKRIDKNRIGKGDNATFVHWLEIRNIFAHGKMINDKILYYGNFFDIQEQSDKHAGYQIKINVILDKFSELRGQYFNQFPIREESKK